MLSFNLNREKLWFKKLDSILNYSINRNIENMHFYVLVMAVGLVALLLSDLQFTTKQRYFNDDKHSTLLQSVGLFKF